MANKTVSAKTFEGNKEITIVLSTVVAVEKIPPSQVIVYTTGGKFSISSDYDFWKNQLIGQ